MKRFIVFGAAALLGVAAPVYAESAPVFDVDNMQQSFDGDAQEAPQDQAFVPSQPTSNQPTVATSNAPPSSGNVNQRLNKVEQQLSNMQGSESGAKVESLQEQVRTLRGQVEQLTHQLQQLQSEQKLADGKKAGVSDPGTLTQANASNDPLTPNPEPKNSKKFATAKPTAKTIVGTDPNSNEADSKKQAVEGQPNVAEEQEIYQTAYNLIKAKKYEEAVTALQGMLKKYPSGQFASNAHYWLGELYGLMGKNDLALNEFSTVVESYPDSPRVSDAQLKVGLIHSAQSNWTDAKSSFKKVINHYPGTASARVASEQLKQIKMAGH